MRRGGAQPDQPDHSYAPPYNDPSNQQDNAAAVTPLTLSAVAEISRGAAAGTTPSSKQSEELTRRTEQWERSLLQARMKDMSADHLKRTKLVEKVKKKEKDLDVYVKRINLKSQKVLVKRNFENNTVTLLEGDRFDQSKTHKSLKDQFIHEVDLRVDEITELKARKYQLEKMLISHLPHWLLNMESKLKAVVAQYGHINKLKWRSKALGILNATIDEAAANDHTAVDAVIALRNLALDVNITSSNGLIRSIGIIRKEYIESFTLDTPVGELVALLKEIDEDIAEVDVMTVPFEKKLWSSKLDGQEEDLRSVAMTAAPRSTQISREDIRPSTSAGNGTTTTKPSKASLFGAALNTQVHSDLTTCQAYSLKMRLAASEGNYPLALGYFYQSFGNPGITVDPSRLSGTGVMSLSSIIVDNSPCRSMLASPGVNSSISRSVSMISNCSPPLDDLLVGVSVQDFLDAAAAGGVSSISDTTIEPYAGPVLPEHIAKTVSTKTLSEPQPAAAEESPKHDHHLQVAAATRPSTSTSSKYHPRVISSNHKKNSKDIVTKEKESRGIRDSRNSRENKEEESTPVIISSVPPVLPKLSAPDRRLPTVEDFKILFRAFKNMKELDFKKIPPYLFALMKSFGVTPTCSLYNVLIEACIRDSRWRRAVNIIRSMRAGSTTSTDTMITGGAGGGGVGGGALPVPPMLPDAQSFFLLSECCRHAVDEPAVIFETLRREGYPAKFCEKCGIINAGNRISTQVVYELMHHTSMLPPKDHPIGTGGSSMDDDFDDNASWASVSSYNNTSRSRLTTGRSQTARSTGRSQTARSTSRTRTGTSSSVKNMSSSSFSDIATTPPTTTATGRRARTATAHTTGKINSTRRTELLDFEDRNGDQRRVSTASKLVRGASARGRCCSPITSASTSAGGRRGGRGSESSSPSNSLVNRMVGSGLGSSSSLLEESADITMSPLSSSMLIDDVLPGLSISEEKSMSWPGGGARARTAPATAVKNTNRRLRRESSSPKKASHQPDDWGFASSLSPKQRRPTSSALSSGRGGGSGGSSRPPLTPQPTTTANDGRSVYTERTQRSPLAITIPPPSSTSTPNTKLLLAITIPSTPTPMPGIKSREKFDPTEEERRWRMLAQNARKTLRDASPSKFQAVGDIIPPFQRQVMRLLPREDLRMSHWVAEKSPSGSGMPSPASHLLAMLSRPAAGMGGVDAVKSKTPSSEIGSPNNKSNKKQPSSVSDDKKKKSVILSPPSEGAGGVGGSLVMDVAGGKGVVEKDGDEFISLSDTVVHDSGHMPSPTATAAAPFINTRTLSSTFRNRIKAISAMSPLHSPSVPAFFNFNGSIDGPNHHHQQQQQQQHSPDNSTGKQASSGGTMTKQVFFFGDDGRNYNDDAPSLAAAKYKDEWPKGVRPKGYIKAFPFERPNLVDL